MTEEAEQEIRQTNICDLIKHKHFYSLGIREWELKRYWEITFKSTEKNKMVVWHGSTSMQPLFTCFKEIKDDITN